MNESTRLQYMTWEDFDEAITYLANKIKSCHLEFKAVYGIPRGGLVVAVVISHRLNIPISFDIDMNGLLVVDDVADSGSTLSRYTSALDTLTLFAKHGTKMVPDFVWKWISDDTWIVFPWEVKKR